MNPNIERETYRRMVAQSLREAMQKDIESGLTQPYYDSISEETYTKEIQRYFKTPDQLSGKTFLDVGSGMGSRLHDILQRFGVNFVNLDITKEAILFRQNMGEMGIVGDAYHLPIKNEVVDGVIMANVTDSGLLADQTDLEDIYLELHRVIKKGGYYLQTQNDPTYGVSQRKEIKTLRNAGFNRVRRFAGITSDGRQTGQAIIASKR